MFCYYIKIALKLVPMYPTDKNSSFDSGNDWVLYGCKPLTDLMMQQSTNACVRHPVLTVQPLLTWINFNSCNDK